MNIYLVMHRGTEEDLVEAVYFDEDKAKAYVKASYGHHHVNEEETQDEPENLRLKYTTDALRLLDQIGSEYAKAILHNLDTMTDEELRKEMGE